MAVVMKLPEADPSVRDYFTQQEPFRWSMRPGVRARFERVTGSLRGVLCPSPHGRCMQRRPK
jgi:hypothetical protein